MKACKRVAIVGGGFCGLLCVKTLKEDGIEPVCFEKSCEIGGTWNYHEEAVEGMPSTMWTTVINHSKEMGSVSDNPPPAELPNYMRHYELMKYYRTHIIDRLNLPKHVICNREVISVKRADDYEKTGRWIVVVKNTENDEVITDCFDGVLVSVGHITYPRIPDFPGIEKFKGKVMHSHSLKRIEPFSGQRVAVIGNGCSALDAAVEISNTAKQVYLSIRTPSWIMPRVGPYGLPMDYVLLRRYSAFIQKVFPLSWASGYMEKKFLDANFNHKLYGIEPKYPALARDPIVNDGLPSKLLSGSVVLRCHVKHFHEDGIIFENDDDNLTKVDTVILATGYDWKFPFLEEGTVVYNNNRINLYKCIFPSHLKYPTLGIVGFLLPFGPGFPLGEMQMRWISYLMSGHGTLPSEKEMLEDIERRYEENVKRYTPSDRMSIRVDFIPYMDEIASEMGVKPNLWKMLFTDHKLFKACAFGPCLPYQYRLEGHNKWDGARNAILTAHKRVRAPLVGNRPRTRKTQPMSKVLFKSFFLLAMVAWLVLYKEARTKYYFLALFLPYIISLRNFSTKYYFILLLLPFYITYEGFVFSYFVTLFTPFLISIFTS